MQAIEATIDFVAAKDMSAVLAVQVRRRLGLGLWTSLHISNLHVEGKVFMFYDPEYHVSMKIYSSRKDIVRL